MAEAKELLLVQRRIEALLRKTEHGRRSRRRAREGGGADGRVRPRTARLKAAAEAFGAVQLGCVRPEATEAATGRRIGPG